MKKIHINEKYIKIFFVLFVFIITVIWTIYQPYNYAPDEAMKMDVCRYIAQNGKLPHGGDPAVRNAIWGISYGFTPILSYIASAGFMKVAMIFTTEEAVLVFAARIMNILLYTATVAIIIKIGDKLFKNPFKWFFITLTSCLPQLMFLGTYINNDILAIFSIAVIIYSWIIGLERKWNIKSCILLAVGVGICALSYYNAYGFILTSVMLFIASFITKKKKEKPKFEAKDFLQKGIIIALIALIIASWWFVRNAVIYDGDFLGLRTEEEYAQKYAIEEFKPSNRTTPIQKGENLIQMLINDGWLRSTYKSFIGVFGNMQFQVSNLIYLCYGLLFIGSIVGLIMYYRKYEKERNKNILQVIFALNIVITVCLSIYYSYASDFQPQGRYIMPMLIPFMYFITIGFKTIVEKIIKNERIRNIIINIISVGLTILPVFCMIFYAILKYWG